MKLISSFLILLVAVAILVVGIAGPRVGATASNGPAYPRLANVYLGGITDPASIAKWDMIIAQGGSNTSQYAPIKASNPNAKILTYIAAQEPTVQLPSPRADEPAGGFSPLWNLTRADGSLITGFGGNQVYNLAAVAPVVGGERWSDHLAAWIIAHKTGDGIYLDNAWGDVAWKDGALDLDHNGVADVSEHGNAWIDSQWEAGLTNLAAKVRAGLGPDALIVANGAALLRSSNNGRLNEGFDGNWVPSLNGSDWATNLHDYQDWSVTHQGVNSYVLLQSGAQGAYATMRFYLGTALLSDGFFAYATPTYDTLSWYDEYSVDVVTGRATGDASHKGYLGQPKGLAVLNANGTYSRAYDGGIVVVNPTGSSQTQALGGSYRLIKGTQDATVNNGATVTSVTLASWDARILLAPASVSTSTSTTTPTRIFLPTLTTTLTSTATRSAGVVSTFVMLAGDTHTVSCGNGTIASSLVNAVVTVTCVAPSTATTTPTNVLPTPTATVAGPRPFALGIRLDKGDQATLDGWNAHALTLDSEHSQGANTALLLAARGTDRSVQCGGAAVLADLCARAIADAVAAHIPDLGVNDEGPPCATLQADEAAVYAKAKAAGLTMTFVPVGHMIVNCGPNAFARNTDRLLYQVEALEQDPSINFGPYVHAQIAALHQARPDLPILVQVSVNPSHNRTATAAQTLADIAALEDGSANAPARVDIFYYARNTVADRADIMLAVQAALRS